MVPLTLILIFQWGKSDAHSVESILCSLNFDPSSMLVFHSTIFPQMLVAGFQGAKK